MANIESDISIPTPTTEADPSSLVDAAASNGSARSGTTTPWMVPSRMTTDEIQRAVEQNAGRSVLILTLNDGSEIAGIGQDGFDGVSFTDAVTADRSYIYYDQVAGVRDTGVSTSDLYTGSRAWVLAKDAYDRLSAGRLDAALTVDLTEGRVSGVLADFDRGSGSLGIRIDGLAEPRRLHISEVLRIVDSAPVVVQPPAPEREMEVSSTNGSPAPRAARSSARQPAARAKEQTIEELCATVADSDSKAAYVSLRGGERHLVEIAMAADTGELSFRNLETDDEVPISVANITQVLPVSVSRLKEILGEDADDAAETDRHFDDDELPAGVLPSVETAAAELAEGSELASSLEGRETARSRRRGADPDFVFEDSGIPSSKSGRQPISAEAAKFASELRGVLARAADSIPRNILDANFIARRVTVPFLVLPNPDPEAGGSKQTDLVAVDKRVYVMSFERSTGIARLWSGREDQNEISGVVDVIGGKVGIRELTRVDENRRFREVISLSEEGEGLNARSWKLYDRLADMPFGSRVTVNFNGPLSANVGDGSAESNAARQPLESVTGSLIFNRRTGRGRILNLEDKVSVDFELGDIKNFKAA